MQRAAPVYRRDFAVHKTSYAKSAYDDLIKRARDAENDTERDKRLEKHECKCCFYVFRGRIGGAAMTEQNCALCHEPQMYGSTNTDVVCMACAKESHICKHCGGDLDMRERRRFWPAPVDKEST
jgi:hypothetical protein